MLRAFHLRPPGIKNVPPFCLWGQGMTNQRKVNMHMQRVGLREQGLSSGTPVLLTLVLLQKPKNDLWPFPHSHTFITSCEVWCRERLLLSAEYLLVACSSDQPVRCHLRNCNVVSWRECSKRALDHDFCRQRNTVSAALSLMSASGFFYERDDSTAFFTHNVLFPPQLLSGYQVRPSSTGL